MQGEIEYATPDFPRARAGRHRRYHGAYNRDTQYPLAPWYKLVPRYHGTSLYRTVGRSYW